MRFRSKWVQEDELGGFLHQEAVDLGSEVVALDRLEGRRCVADNRGQSSRPCPALQHRCSNATGWQQGFVELGWGLETGSKAAGAALSRRDMGAHLHIPSQLLGGCTAGCPHFPGLQRWGGAPAKHISCHVRWCRADRRALCRAPGSAACSAGIQVWVCGLGGGSSNSFITWD